MSSLQGRVVRSADGLMTGLQVGSFVPAERARMHVFDAVHTRMGASDNLAMGRSTFLEVSAYAAQLDRRIRGKLGGETGGSWLRITRNTWSLFMPAK